MSTPLLAPPLPLDTNVVIRVIACDGKFLGDDIGGAHVIVRDALTREILDQGYTAGGSGNNDSPTTKGVMCVALKRGEPLPTDNASSFTARLKLSRPRRIEVTAYGPLGALGSANAVSSTQWVFPGKHITAGNGFLLELRGLIVQIIDPVTHYAPAKVPTLFNIRANVAMMCGCPISDKAPNTICSGTHQPWLPGDFEVQAEVVMVPKGGTAQPPTTITLTYTPSFGTAGQFVGTFPPLPGTPLPLGSYQITVYAFQPSTGNTGVDTATVFLN